MCRAGKYYEYGPAQTQPQSKIGGKGSTEQDRSGNIYVMGHSVGLGMVVVIVAIAIALIAAWLLD